MDDLISRRLLMKEFTDFVKNSNNSDFARTPTWNDAVSIVDSTPNAKPEQDMCNDLMQFIDKEEVKDNRTVADWVVQWILEEIISGTCKITGSATDHKEAKMYVEFTFYRSEHDVEDS